MTTLKKYLFSIIAAVTLSACVSQPDIPHSDIVTVEQNIQKAKEEHAYEYAPIAIQSAEKNLADAKRAMENEDYQTAKKELEKATVDSEHALAVTDAEKAKAASKEVSKSLQSLKNANK